MPILCATDFSLAASAAADVAAALAKKLSQPLRLLHCGADYIVMGELPVAPPDDRTEIEQLEAEADRLRATGVEVTEEFRRGAAAMEIAASATENAVDLIVLGSVGKGGVLDRWLVGSVAEHVAESAAVPTLVVRRAEDLIAWLQDGPPLKLMCGVDFTPSSDAAVAWVKKLSAAGPVSIGATFVQSFEGGGLSPEQQQDRQRDVWDKVHAALGDLPMNIQVSEAFGQPAKEFLRIASEHSASLLVIGTHQHHGLHRLVSPSFSRSVVAYAPANVLCVPAVHGGPPETSIPEIRRVLLATDFSESALDALRHANSLLRPGGELRLVHVCLEPSRGINPVIASEVYFDHTMASAAAREEAAKKLKGLPEALTRVTGVRFTSEILTHHDVAAAICDAADRFGADVICMGTTGHTRTGAAILGSSVQSVLARSSKPVFVVTPPRH